MFAIYLKIKHFLNIQCRTLFFHDHHRLRMDGVGAEQERGCEGASGGVLSRCCAAILPFHRLLWLLQSLADGNKGRKDESPMRLRTI